MSVYLDYAGQPVRVEDLRWLVVAPCGCPSGVMTVEHNGLTPEAAKSSMNDGIAKLIKADRGEYVLKSHDDMPWDFIKSGTCQHVPKWGREPLPGVEGYEWRACCSTAHLVPQGEEHRYRAPVCITSYKYVSLSPAAYGVGMTVPCRKCLTWAKANSGVS